MYILKSRLYCILVSWKNTQKYQNEVYIGIYMHLNIQNINLEIDDIVHGLYSYILKGKYIGKSEPQNEFFPLKLKLFYCTHLLPNYLIR